jgi:FlaA1/EpsC-like NDP-sugar epimerase
MFKKEKILLITFDLILLVSSFYLAVLIRFEGELSPRYTNGYVWLFLANAFLCAGVFHAFGLYDKLWRYAGVQELKNIFTACIVAYMPVFTAALLTGGTYYSRSIIIIAGMLTFFLTGGTRFLLRILNEQTWTDNKGRKAVIVGANDVGETILRDVLRRKNGVFKPIGFIDEEHGRLKIRIHGVPVLGTISELPRIIREQGVEQIIIALRSPSLIRKVISQCEKLKVEFKVVPDLSEILDGKLSVSSVRNVEIEDLLERKPVSLCFESLKSFFENKRVLVTGAGGAIGSEICRQVACYDVEQLILSGRGENSIYEIALELQGKPGKPPVQFIGDIRDKKRMEVLMETCKPDVVFHTAAHKHVPLMETNPSEAVTNNVLGTRNLIELSEKYGVENFLLISTDKAVNPTSVMGATKRLAEMYMKSFCSGEHKCRFSAVRFGNVLNSRGSVIPTFKRQIVMGGPVTVTHEDMTRYFMTIPEAVQLVIQAGAMGKDGEIFILDIGEPVRIIDLARNMIKLSGFEPGKDIEIEISGIRPGEKLEEHLINITEDAEKTDVEKIMRINTDTIPLDKMETNLAGLEKIAENGNDESIRAFLGEIVPGYKNNHL